MHTWEDIGPLLPFLSSISFLCPWPRPICSQKDECVATRSQTAVCFFALYRVVLGFGGIKPCVSSYGADQFDESDEVEKDHKSSFFNWLYFSINLGELIASSVLVWKQLNIGWGWGFAVPTISMIVAVAFFCLGTQLYRYQKPDSPLTRLCCDGLIEKVSCGVSLTKQQWRHHHIKA